MEFKRRRLTFTLDGESHGLNYPSVGQLQEYNKKLKSSGSDKEFDLMVEFFEGLGLPKDISMSLEAEHLQAIVNELSGVKKK